MPFQFVNFRATKPVVCLIDPVKKIYEVFFIVYDAGGKRKRFRYKRGINSLPKVEREAQAKAMADVLWQELNSGWNPLATKYPTCNDRHRHEAAKMFFCDALEYAMKVKKPGLSKYSAYDYEGTVRFINKAAAAEQLATVYIDEIERRDIRLIMATAKEQNKWSPNARNKYLTILKSLLSVLEEEEIIKINPAYRLKNEPTTEGLGYKRLSDDQKEEVAKKLIADAPGFFDYILFIYQAGIRRTELLNVRIGDIDLRDRSMVITGEVAKMNRSRKIPITFEMLEILVRRDVESINPGWYLFSSSKFDPGPGPYHPNTPTLWWRRLVIDEMGIDCKMYSLKHKGADDKILAGIDIDALRAMYGHRSRQMTEVYAREVKNQYAKQIIDHAPTFARVVKLKAAK